VEQTEEASERHGAELTVSSREKAYGISTVRMSGGAAIVEWKFTVQTTLTLRA
jgi:hypothetical protein